MRPLLGTLQEISTVALDIYGNFMVGTPDLIDDDIKELASRMKKLAAQRDNLLKSKRVQLTPRYIASGIVKRNSQGWNDASGDRSSDFDATMHGITTLDIGNENDMRVWEQNQGGLVSFNGEGLTNFYESASRWVEIPSSITTQVRHGYTELPQGGAYGKVQKKDFGTSWPVTFSQPFKSDQVEVRAWILGL